MFFKTIKITNEKIIRKRDLVVEIESKHLNSFRLMTMLVTQVAHDENLKKKKKKKKTEYNHRVAQILNKHIKERLTT